MGKRLTNILPKISQYEGIHYAGDLNCPHCDKSGFFDGYGETRVKPNVIGWCDTDIGYMAVFECPVCFEKFRFHCTIGTWIADMEDCVNFSFLTSSRHWDTWIKWINKLYSYDKRKI